MASPCSSEIDIFCRIPLAVYARKMYMEKNLAHLPPRIKTAIKAVIMSRLAKGKRIENSCLTE
jgi:hypothetical protein